MAESKIRILQINTNRSKQAHDMALATARELSVDVLIVSEPNKSAMRGRKDWIFDDRLNSALKVLNTDIKIKGQGQGCGYSYVVTNKMTLFSCYSSGNDEIEDLDNTLVEIESHIRVNNNEAVIAGDFNAKSPQWGMNVTDRRGQLLIDWIAANDLVLSNKGNKPTFTRGDYSSILDLTIATANVRINNWDVLETESLSDHNYIMFDIVNGKQPTNPKRSHMGGWQVKKLDQVKLQDRLANLEKLENYRDLIRTLNQICNEVMPKKRNNNCKRPVYWWNEDIAHLRSNCLRKRRNYSRNVRRMSLVEIQPLWEAYTESKKALRNSIKRAKKNSWKTLCDSIDSDIWGEGYKIAMKGMLGFPPALSLTDDVMETVVNHLFPKHAKVVFNCDISDKFLPFTLEEMQKAGSKLKSNKAPGPGYIPPEIIKKVVGSKSDYILPVYNRLANEGNFPSEWKKARLVLLRKGNKPLDDPSSFRPICLMDIEGKLYEHLLLDRLNVELERTGGLSSNQFGFRKGRQTIDAVNEVLRAARQALAEREFCVVVTIDVKNAFNSASWQLILEKLRAKGISESLIRVIASYLSERAVLLETNNAVKCIETNSGVPQGSVKGPTLWNVLYDDLLRTEMPEGVALVGFADDVALIAKTGSEDILTSQVNRGLFRVSSEMERLKLKLAPEKTEAVMFTKRRNVRPVRFELQGTNFGLSKSVKYLGVWLDSKLTFAEHVNQTITKAEKTIKALTNLMPNIGGPRSSKRKILSSVAHSQMLYGAPAFHTAVQNKKLLQKLTSTQRRLILRICSAYRTVSAEGACVITGIPPIELQITERRERYMGVAKAVAKDSLAHCWQEKWDRGIYGRWTHRLIPNIQRWINRPFGEVDYYLTQALSGHGCFRRYLYDRRRAESPNCPYCQENDNAEHTLFFCPKWEDTRATYHREFGRPFNETNMMESLTTSELSWQKAYVAIRHIIETKEKESNARNLQP